MEVGGGVHAGVEEVLGFLEVVGAGFGLLLLLFPPPPPPPPLNDHDIWKTPAPGSYSSVQSCHEYGNGRDIRRSN